MEQETTNVCSKKECCGKMNRGGTSEAVYGLGLIGAAIYFIQHAPSFWIGVFGVLKAIVWPAILIYNLFGFLKL